MVLFMILNSISGGFSNGGSRNHHEFRYDAVVWDGNSFVFRDGGLGCSPMIMELVDEGGTND